MKQHYLAKSNSVHTNHILRALAEALSVEAFKAFNGSFPSSPESRFQAQTSLACGFEPEYNLLEIDKPPSIDRYIIKLRKSIN